jgi:hypothetical protein
MGRYLLVVQTNAIEGRDREFNDWYDQLHIPELLAVPGVVAARRYELGEHQLGNGMEPMMSSSQPFRYLAIYEIETQDDENWIRELETRIRTAQMQTSDALSPIFAAAMWKALSI